PASLLRSSGLVQPGCRSFIPVRLGAGAAGAGAGRSNPMTRLMAPITTLALDLRRKLVDFLEDAFEVNDLYRLATEKLSFEDVRIAKEVDFSRAVSDVTFSLVEVVLRHGRLAELVLAVREARPNRVEAAQLAAALSLEGVAASFGGEDAIAGVVR